MSRFGLAAVLVVGLLGGHAAAGDARGLSEYYVDEVVPLPVDGIAPVSFRAGPVEIVGLEVRNRPTEQDIAEDTRRRDTSRPKPIITARNHGTEVASLTLVSILEDAKGGRVFRCQDRKPQELDAGEKDDWNTCVFEGMLTSDWPKVTHFHVIATIRVREATTNTPPRPAVDADGHLTISFASASATGDGAAVRRMMYSESLDDVAHAGTEFADGVVTVRGQVGLGKGSRWAGLGAIWDLRPHGAPMDASGFKSVTLRLASSAKQLRVRMVGPDPVVGADGCYPIAVVDVSSELADRTIPLSWFLPESRCGTRGRKVAETLQRLTGIEVVSTGIDERPLFISLGATTLSR